MSALAGSTLLLLQTVTITVSSFFFHATSDHLHLLAFYTGATPAARAAAGLVGGMSSWTLGTNYTYDVSGGNDGMR